MGEADALQRPMRAFSASLIIGMFWTQWHFPSMIQMGQRGQLRARGFVATVAFRIIPCGLTTTQAAQCSLLSPCMQLAKLREQDSWWAYCIQERTWVSRVLNSHPTAMPGVALWGPKTFSQLRGRNGHEFH